MSQFPATANDYRRLAERRLPRFLFDYIDGGASQEHTLKANQQAWQHIFLKQKVLIDVEQISTATELFGETLSMPLALAPIGLAGMMAQRGEAQAVRAANTMQVPFTLSTVGICSIEEVANTSSSPFWFQLYMIRDRTYIQALLKKAWAAGCRTLVFTVDLPQPGMRYRDTRNGLNAKGFIATYHRLQQVLARPGWIWRVALKGKPLTFGNLADVAPAGSKLDAFKAWVDNQFDPSVTWNDIAWLRQHWQGNLILKGILDAQDAEQAAIVGADAIVVSNHGGRQLDGTPATANALPHIAAHLKNISYKSPKILVDGGIRSGNDIFRALALGADGVMIGRPWIWALASGGEPALIQLLTHWQRELELAMMLTGVTRITDINASHLEQYSSS